MATNQIGLYYPFIHFKDDNWLKLAALYWDGMARIVPAGHPPKHDSDTVKKLIDELDFIENIEPGDSSMKVGIHFMELLEKHGGELSRKYDVSLEDSWPDDPITAATAPAGSDPKLAYVFNEKLSDKLKNALGASNLAAPNRGGDDRWVGMHPRLAFVYMEALADEMARLHGVHPLTDETRDHIAVAGWTVERLAQALLGDVILLPPEPAPGLESERQLVQIAFQTVIPDDMSKVPVEQIIAFRRAHFAELVNFQACIKGMVAEIQKLEIGDEKSFKKHLQLAYEKNIKLEQDALEKALKSAKIKTTVGAMLVSTAQSSIAALATAALGVAAPLVAVGGVALGLTKVFLDYRKATDDEMQKNPAAYLLRMEKELKPASLLDWVIADTHRFLSGNRAKKLEPQP